MTGRLNKKLSSLILILFFFAVQFNFLVTRATAAPYPSIIPPQINIDLSAWLLNDASLDIPAGDLAAVEAIPSDLYEPGRQGQAEKVVDNIRKDPNVSNRVKEATAAMFACENDIVFCNNPFGRLPSPELTALNRAKDALIKALTSARYAQKPTIEAYQAQNAAADAISDKYANYSEIASSSDAGIAGINQIDNKTSQNSPITPEQIEAARIARENASAWNTDDSVALKMQEDCSFGFPKAFGGTGEMNLMPCFAEVV